MINQRKFPKNVKSIAMFIHKWAGLMLAIQILFWIAGGLIMSAIPLEKVHGKHLAQRTLTTPFLNQDYVYSIDSLIRKLNANINRIDYAQVLDEPYYLVSTDTGQHAYHGVSGDILRHLTKDTIQHIALRHYLGSEDVKRVTLLDTVPLEAKRNASPVWQVVFDDVWNTTLYISNNTAQLTTIRSDLWRIFDFVWMLHIMDYDERDNFNNPLLIMFAASSLVFTLTGFVLLFYSFRLRKMRRI